MMNKTVSILALAAIALTSCKKEDDDNAVPVQQGAPTAVQLEVITLTGFNELNGDGSHWDGSNGGNPPDPFVKVYKDGVLLYTSAVVSSASSSGTHDMSTGSFGSLPISFGDGTELKIKLYDDDGNPDTNAPDYIGEVVINDALTFLYGGDHASGYEDQLVTGSGGSTFLLTGSFVY